MTTTTNYKLLSVCPNDSSFFPTKLRFSVDGNIIKYVTADPNSYPGILHTRYGMVPMDFPPFPVGSWDIGHISRDPKTGKPYFSSLKTLPPPEVTTIIWHPTQIDYLELTSVRTLIKYGESWRLVTHPLFNKPVLMKMSGFPPLDAKMCEAETRAYQMLEGTGITHPFLGHVIEGGRVVGVLLDYIQETRYPGDASDIDACHEAIKKMHGLGIVHGNAHRKSFYVKDGNAFICNFESASFQTADEACSGKEDFDRLTKSVSDYNNRLHGMYCRGVDKRSDE